jgi:enoyl-CoA hydratase/carnithine racemase
MSDQLVRLERSGPIATIAIARSQRRNAITPQMMRRLIEAATALNGDEETRAVVVRAEGADFSVGADLAPPREAGPAPSLLMRRRAAELGGQLMRAIQDIPQPTICAVQGIATGAGACIASACDFRLATQTARMGYGEVKIGINLMWRALPVCVHLVGPARAKRMIMSGRLFDASTLERWGFVDDVVPLEALDSAALALAQEYAALPPIAVQMIKRSVDQVAGALDAAIMHADVDQWLLATHSEDYREAISAFFEKRAPTFRGN